ncbi:heat shock cognate 70 kDa protein-like protein [Tanacetum coccineum]
MTPYTAYPDIQGIIYQDDLNRNRLMRTDELHKFSDGTLNHVRTTHNDIAFRIRIDYLLKIQWGQQDKRRAHVMISAIDRKLRDRRSILTDSKEQIKMEMEATKDAEQLAGLNVMLLIIQPTSAAIACGLDKSGDINSPNDKSVCIFDMGRGTFDVSLLIISKDGTFTFKAVGGDTHLGSKDFDKTMGKFEELNLDFFNKCIEHVETCLRDGEFFDGKPHCKSINTDEAKAYGAAALASNLCGNGNEKMKDLIILDETPLSLGIRLGYETMSVVIPRNTPIPTMKEHVYNTQFDNQVSAKLKVYQRESNNIRENILLGLFVLDDIRAAPVGEQKLKVCFNIDSNGILNV